MRGEERAQTVRQAFDTSLNKIDEQVRRYKEKSQTRSRRHNNRDDVAGTVNNASLAAAGISTDGISQNANGSSTQLASENDEDEGMVRVKRFALKPMSAEEASLQMELLGHTFLRVRDASNDQVSVVYRRRSGGFGLLNLYQIKTIEENGMPGRVWTRDRLIEAIQQLSEQGIDLSPTAIQKTHGALFSSARSRSHFGNWRAAVQAAGLDYDCIKRVQQRWSRDSMWRKFVCVTATAKTCCIPNSKRGIAAFI
jgi:hypothetical protein